MDEEEPPASPWTGPDGQEYKFSPGLLKRIVKSHGGKKKGVIALDVLKYAVEFNDKGNYLDREEIEYGAIAAKAKFMPESPWKGPDGQEYKFTAAMLTKITAAHPGPAAIDVLIQALKFNDKGNYLDVGEIEAGAKAAVELLAKEKEVTADLELQPDAPGMAGATAPAGSAERKAFEEKLKAALAAELGVAAECLVIE